MSENPYIDEFNIAGPREVRHSRFFNYVVTDVTVGHGESLEWEIEPKEFGGSRAQIIDNPEGHPYVRIEVPEVPGSGRVERTVTLKATFSTPTRGAGIQKRTEEFEITVYRPDPEEYL